MAFEGKVAVVTGGARGIGLAYARRFMAGGARILIGDLDQAAGAEAASALAAEFGGEARFVSCDVTRRADVEALMTAAVEAFGGLDIVIANAGIVHHGGFFETEVEDFRQVLDVNVKGVFLTGQIAARRMVALGRPGVIINIASTNAVVVNNDQTPYPVSKGAVAAMTRVMAVALADHGIRVNAIGPGPTLTPMLEHAMEVDPDFRRGVDLRTPLRRPARPSEMAAVAAFLASDDASYMTGQVVYADGGRLALNYVMPARPNPAPEPGA